MLEFRAAGIDLYTAARAAFRLTTKEMIRETGNVAVSAQPFIPIFALVVCVVRLKSDPFVQH